MKAPTLQTGSTLHRHGKPPYTTAVIHGGPGAGGELAPVAARLSRSQGVLEPIQTAASVQGQVAELKMVLESCAKPPVILVGFSWGAWLGWLVTAGNPRLVKKLILVGCPPFEEQHAASIFDTRMGRLKNDEKSRVRDAIWCLQDGAAGEGPAAMHELDKLFAKTDTYRLHDGAESIPEHRLLRPEIFCNVWPQAAALRKSGRLLRLAKKIRCPVRAIHGDYDPHPAAGVKGPLAGLINDFRFFLLTRCGHKPWVEKHAAARFYQILRREMS